MIEFSDGLSLAALILSGLAWYDAKKASRLSVELSRRETELAGIQLEKEALENVAVKKAEVSARIFNEGKNSRIRVFNTGPAEARNVQLILDNQNSIVSEGAFAGVLPMERMERGQSVDATAYVHMSSPRKEKLTIQWDDDIGDGRRKTIELTV